MIEFEEHYINLWRKYTPNWKKVVWKAYIMNDTTQWFSGKRENVLLFSGIIEITLPQHTQMYSKAFLGIWQYLELSSKLVIGVFPEFQRVASFMVYALHPTTFYQSGVHTSCFRWSWRRHSASAYIADIAPGFMYNVLSPSSNSNLTVTFVYIVLAFSPVLYAFVRCTYQC